MLHGVNSSMDPSHTAAPPVPSGPGQANSHVRPAFADQFSRGVHPTLSGEHRGLERLIQNEGLRSHPYEQGRALSADARPHVTSTSHQPLASASAQQTTHLHSSTAWPAGQHLNMQQPEHQPLQPPPQQHLQQPPEDPLVTSINELFNQLTVTQSLAIAKQDFTQLSDPVHSDSVEKAFQHLLPSYLDGVCKNYGNEMDEFLKALYAFKKDAALFSKGHVPKPLTHKNGNQFKKEIKEQYDGLQSEADKLEAQADFKRGIEANQAWVQKKSTELEDGAFIKAKLEELYERLLELTQRFTREQLDSLRRHVVYSLLAKLPALKSKAQKKYEGFEKNKNDEDAKQKENEEKFDQLLMQYPKVSLAVMFRELEDRLLAAVCAKRNQMEEEYRRARRGQQLSILEAQVYALKDELSKNGMPHLESRMTSFFSRHKSRSKTSGAERARSGGGNGKRKSHSRSKTDRNNSRDASQSKTRCSSNTAHTKGRSSSKNHTKGRGKGKDKGGKGGKNRSTSKDCQSHSRNRSRASTSSQHSATSRSSNGTSSMRGRSRGRRSQLSDQNSKRSSTAASSKSSQRKHGVQKRGGSRQKNHKHHHSRHQQR